MEIFLDVSVMVGGFYATVDHLVNNAGVTRIELFEDFTQFSDIASIMVIIFILFLLQNYGNN